MHTSSIDFIIRIILSILLMFAATMTTALSFQSAPSASNNKIPKHKFALLFEQSEEGHKKKATATDHQFLKNFFDTEDDPTDNSGSLGWLRQLGDLEIKYEHFNEARKIYINDLMRRSIFYEKHDELFSSEEGVKLLASQSTMQIRYNLAASSAADLSIKIAEFEESQSNPDQAKLYYQQAIELYQRHNMISEAEKYLSKIN